jgi:hypothetical protein
MVREVTLQTRPNQLILNNLHKSAVHASCPDEKNKDFPWLIVLHLKSLSLTHMHLQDGTANQRHPLFSSESPQHISIKKQE